MDHNVEWLKEIDTNLHIRICRAVDILGYQPPSTNHWGKGVCYESSYRLRKSEMLGHANAPVILTVPNDVPKVSAILNNFFLFILFMKTHFLE